MDYAKLKVGAYDVAFKLSERLQECIRRRQAAEARLTEEKAGLERLEERKAKLCSMADESLAGGPGEYEKFKTSIRKLDQDIDTSKTAISTLEKSILPAQAADTQAARSKLQNALNTFFLTNKAELETELTGVLGQAVELVDQWHDFTAAIYAKYGSACDNVNRTFTPRAKHGRVDAKHGLIIKPRKTDDRLAAIDAAKKSLDEAA
jgi:chromosome segregation ATPase